MILYLTQVGLAADASLGEGVADIGKHGFPQRSRLGGFWRQQHGCIFYATSDRSAADGEENDDEHGQGRVGDGRIEERRALAELLARELSGIQRRCALTIVTKRAAQADRVHRIAQNEGEPAMYGAHAQDHKGAAGPAAALSAVMEAQRRYAEAAIRATQGLAGGAAASAETIADFMRKRVDEELALVSDLVGCKSPLEACAVCNSAWLAVWNTSFGYWCALGQGALRMTHAVSDALAQSRQAEPAGATSDEGRSDVPEAS